MRREALAWFADKARGLTPSLPQEWEIRAAERAELERLRLRVAELESELDEIVDAAIKEPVPKRKPGRPKKS